MGAALSRGRAVDKARVAACVDDKFGDVMQAVPGEQEAIRKQIEQCADHEGLVIHGVRLKRGDANQEAVKRAAITSLTGEQFRDGLKIELWKEHESRLSTRKSARRRSAIKACVFAAVDKSVDKAIACAVNTAPTESKEGIESQSSANVGEPKPQQNVQEQKQDEQRVAAADGRTDESELRKEGEKNDPAASADIGEHGEFVDVPIANQNPADTEAIHAIALPGANSDATAAVISPDNAEPAIAAQQENTEHATESPVDGEQAANSTSVVQQESESQKLQEKSPALENTSAEAADQAKACATGSSVNDEQTTGTSAAIAAIPKESSAAEHDDDDAEAQPRQQKSVASEGGPAANEDVGSHDERESRENEGARISDDTIAPCDAPEKRNDEENVETLRQEREEEDRADHAVKAPLSDEAARPADAASSDDVAAV